MSRRVNVNGRPVVPAQRSRSDAVLPDVEQSERMAEEIELLSDVRTASQQIDAGRDVSNIEAKAELRRRFTR
jgi:hypothetical protein